MVAFTDASLALQWCNFYNFAGEANVKALRLEEDIDDGTLLVCATGKLNGYYTGNLFKTNFGSGGGIWGKSLGGSPASEYIFQDAAYSVVWSNITALSRANGGNWGFTRIIVDEAGGKKQIETFNSSALVLDTSSTSAIATVAEMMSIYSGTTGTVTAIRNSPLDLFDWAKQYQLPALFTVAANDKTYDGGLLTVGNTPAGNGKNASIFMLKSDSAGIVRGCTSQDIAITRVYSNDNPADITVTETPAGFSPTSAQLQSQAAIVNPLVYCSQQYCPAVPPDTSGCLASYAKRYTDYNWCVYPGSLTPTADGGLLVTGIQRDNPYVVSEQTFVTRLDSKGNIAYSGRIQAGGPGFLIGTISLTDGNFISTLTTGADNNPTITICKHDGQYNVIWQKSYTTALQNTNITKLISDPAGNIYLSIEYSDFSSFPDHYAILKFSPDGSLVWQETYAMPSSNCIVWDQSMSFLNGFLYVATNYDPYTANSVLLAKTDPSNGSVKWTQQFAASNGDFQINDFITVGNYTLLALSIDQPTTTLSGLLLFDQDGNLVKQRQYTSNGQSMSLYGLTAGPNNTVTAITSYQYGIVFLDSNLHVTSVKSFTSNLLGSAYVATRDASGNFIELFDNIFTDGTNGDAYYENFSVLKYSANGTVGECPAVAIPAKDTILPATIVNAALMSPGGTHTVTPVTLANLAIEDFTINEAAELCGSTNNCQLLKLNGAKNICNSKQAYKYTLQRSPGCTPSPSWLFDTALVSAQSITDTTITITFKKTGNLKLKAVLNTGCTPLQDSLLINVANNNDSLYLGRDTVLCANGSLLLKAGAQFLSYQWQDNSTDSNLLATKPGLYYVKVTDGCLNSYADSITLSPDNLPGIALGRDTAKCNNDSIQLRAPSTLQHYVWQPATYISATDTNAVWINPPKTTQYTVTAIKANGCTAFDTVLVTVNTSPAIYLGSDTSICANDSLPLDAGGGFTSWLWSTGAVSENITVRAAGVYSVKATAANGCSSFDSIRLNNIIPLPVFSLGNDTALCSGQVLSYLFNLPGASYLWGTGSTADSQTITQPGTYWLQVTQQGCSSTDSVTVNFKPLPVVNLGSDTTMCPGGTKLLDATAAGATYLWQDGSTTPDFTITAPGAYYVTVTLNGCSGADTVTATYLPLPQFYLGNDTFICKGTSFVLAPELNTPANYLWQDGSKSNIYTVNGPGVYTLTAANTCGQFTDSITITTGLCKLVMPTAFTPNNDGVNDVFRVKYLFPVNAFHMVVYNRWGQKIYESGDIGQGWDGTFQGALQPPGAYIWVIDLTDADGSKESGHGTVVLIR